MRRRYFLLFLFILACKKDLDITEFSSDFSDYKPELRIEALILPGDSTAIVRIDKSFLITDTELYDCRDNDFGEISLDSCNTIEGIWHGKEGIDTIADCGNWNPFLHDIGSDGTMSIDENGDGKYEGWEDIAPDDDGTENNGSPDCGEPNVDNYAEILPGVHNSLCDVYINKISDNLTDTCDFHFADTAGHFFDYRYTGGKPDPTLENIEMINYGAYVPNVDCSKNYWGDYDAQYEFNCDCSESGFGIIKSNEPILLSKPVVFFNVQDSLSIIECSDHSCLQNTTSLLNGAEYDSLYFGRYSVESYINYASISPNVTFEAIQYMYDKQNDEFKYFHGHPAAGTDMFNIVNEVCVMREKILSDYYDGVGNGEWDEGELFADINNNNAWDSTEYFIDLGDDSLDVNTYYYEIFTFSESYRDYYYFFQLSLDDPERTNLRDQQSGNPVMGAFGSLSSEKIYFRIIDCLDFLLDEESCTDEQKTHGVCSWYPNVVIDDYTGPACLPINWDF